MHRTMQMEEFSRAYVKAIAAQARYTPYRPEVDDDSIDIGVAGRGIIGRAWKCS